MSLFSVVVSDILAATTDTLATRINPRTNDSITITDAVAYAKLGTNLKQILLTDVVTLGADFAYVGDNITTGGYSLLITPYFRQGGVSQSAQLAFEIIGVTTVTTGTLRVFLDGNLAYASNTFKAGYVGTIGGGTVMNSLLRLTLTAHPLYQHREVDVAVTFTDASGFARALSSTFTALMPSVEGLRAAPDLAGGKVLLTWTALPAGTASLKIFRSPSAYANYLDDPGELVQTVVAPATGVAGSYSDTVLPGLYYYTLFLTFVATGVGLAVYNYTSNDCRVAGLSLEDYQAQQPDYLYKLFPRYYRIQDADPELGADQYRLRNYCRALQGAVSAMRGELTLLDLMRDPDTMPLGRIGRTGNSLGLIAAYNRDLGFEPEQNFDAGVLRRTALGITSVHQKKGTCVGLEELTKMLTTWTGRCEELIEPVCGVNRLLTWWEGESRIVKATGRIGSPTYTPVSPVILQTAPGSLIVPKTLVKDALGAALATELAPTSSGLRSVASLYTRLGDLVCVSNIDNDPADITRYKLTLGDAASYVRSEIQVTVSAANLVSAGVYDLIIPAIAAATWPWQFPSPGDEEPFINENAFDGLKMMTANGVVCTIVYTTATNPYTRVWSLRVTAGGAPNAGTASISEDFEAPTNYAARKPAVTLKMIVGELSFYYDPAFDSRLLRINEVSPTAIFPNLGATFSAGGGSQFAGGPDAVILWLS